MKKTSWEKRFDKKWKEHCWYLPVSTEEEIKQFIKEELATQRMKAITMVKDEVVKADKYTIGPLERVRTKMVLEL